MYFIEAHVSAAEELVALPDDLRGRMFRLIKRLETDGPALRMPHSKAIGDGLFELRVGGVNISRCLYAFAVGNKIYLLHAFVKKTEKTPAAALAIARKRLNDLKDSEI